MSMYSVRYSECKSIFDSFGEEKQKIVTDTELIEMLKDSNIHVSSANYYNSELDKK